jgi:hypothetical protein
MRLSKSQCLSNVAGSKRLVQLAAAFAAFRSVHGPGRRIPLGLRRQVLAALDDVLANHRTPMIPVGLNTVGDSSTS